MVRERSIGEQEGGGFAGGEREKRLFAKIILSKNIFSPICKNHIK